MYGAFLQRYHTVCCLRFYSVGHIRLLSKTTASSILSTGPHPSPPPILHHPLTVPTPTVCMGAVEGHTQVLSEGLYLLAMVENDCAVGPAVVID